MRFFTDASTVWSNRSLWPIGIATIAAGLSFYVPVSALFLGSRGLSFQDIFLLESILLAGILTAEIPSGLLADRVDRRWVIFSGFLLNAIAEGLFAFGQSFTAFALSFALSGVGIAMLTGVQDAYIYDSLGENADELSVGVWGHLSALDLVAGVASSFLGGIFASWNVAFPALLSAVTALIAAGAVMFLPSQSPHSDANKSPETIWASLKLGSGLLLRTPVLLYTAVASSAVFVIFNAVFTLNQPLFQLGHVPVAYWGLIGGAGQLLAAIYNHFAGAIAVRIGQRNALCLAMGYGALGFGLMAIPHPVFVVLGFLLAVLGMFARGPITRAVTNKLIPSERRATVLNVSSSLGSVIGIAVNPMIGWGADYNPTITVGVIAVFLALMAWSWIPIANRFLDQ